MSEEQEIQLKPEHERFALEYIICLNATQAYLKVYPDSSQEAARRSASRLMTNADVQAFIACELKKNREILSSKIERILRAHDSLAYSNIYEFLDVSESSVSLVDPDFIDLDKQQAVKKITFRKRSKSNDEGYEEEISIGLELHEKKSSLNSLERYTKMMEEVVDDSQSDLEFEDESGG